MLAIIIEKQGFRASLAFVIAGSHPDRIDMSPVFLGLRMN
jgi:hypothetical protein